MRGEGRSSESDFQRKVGGSLDDEKQERNSDGKKTKQLWYRGEVGVGIQCFKYLKEMAKRE